MKPLYHPEIKDVTVEGILYALSNPIRVNIYMSIAVSDCPQICAKFINFESKKIAKSTLSQHFRILRESGLIRSERKGVELHNTTRCDELKKKFGDMVKVILEAYKKQQEN